MNFFRNTCLVCAITGCVVMVGMPSFSYARTVDFDEVAEQHQDQIRTILSCGSWEKSNQHGFFRVIEVYLYGQSFVYVQWMSDYDNDAATHVIKTTAISEFDDDHDEKELSDIACSAEKDGVLVTAKVVSGYDDGDVTHRMRLKLNNTPGSYSLKISSATKSKK